MTGALDAVVVDYQCIMPSLVTVAECMGTKIVTTMEICKITGATHIPFSEEAASAKNAPPDAASAASEPGTAAEAAAIEEAAAEEAAAEEVAPEAAEVDASAEAAEKPEGTAG